MLGCPGSESTTKSRSGRKGVEARGRRQRWSQSAAERFPSERVGARQDRRVGFEATSVGIHGCPAAILGDLHARSAERGESVERRIVHPDPHGEAVPPEPRRLVGVVVGDLFTCHRQRQGRGEGLEQRCGPCIGCDHHLRRDHDVAISETDVDLVVVRLDRPSRSCRHEGRLRDRQRVVAGAAPSPPARRCRCRLGTALRCRSPPAIPAISSPRPRQSTRRSRPRTPSSNRDMSRCRLRRRVETDRCLRSRARTSHHSRLRPPARRRRQDASGRRSAGCGSCAG